MPNVIDSLVFDRTQEDVDYAKEIKQRIIEGGFQEALTQEERSEYLAGLKGCYNCSDMNRVGRAIQYLDERIRNIPSEISAIREESGVPDSPEFHMRFESEEYTSPNVFTSWGFKDFPRDSDDKTYINAISEIRKMATRPEDLPSVPSTLSRLTYTEANSIEKILSDAYHQLNDEKEEIISKIGPASFSAHSEGSAIVIRTPVNAHEDGNSVVITVPLSVRSEGSAIVIGG